MPLQKGTTQSFSMGAAHQQADFAGFMNLPVQGSQIPGPGLYPTHVVVSAQSPGACVGSGGTFGVSDEQNAGTQLTVEPGPLATFDYHELVNHRLSSPYGAGWTVKELERVYRAGDVAFLVHGDGADERFRPRAYPTPITEQIGPFRLTRDPQTGELFLVEDNGVIARIDPITGARTTILSGLALSSGVRGAAVAYVGAARHFAIALTTGLVDVDASGALTVLATRAAPAQFRDASVAARGELVFYTDAVSAPVYRTRLSDPAHVVDAISLASGGDVRLYPRVPLSGVTFADPRGMDFGADGTLYLADVQRNVVYALGPQPNGEIGPASVAAPAIGDGSSTFFAPLGERAPGAKLAIREPLAITTAEDGTLLVLTAYGAAWYDPQAREAEWLTFWSNLDEITLNPSRVTVHALALGQSSFLLRTDVPSSTVMRVDVDRLSSEFEPTRTLKKLAGGGIELTDTTQEWIEVFDSAGRISQRKRRTGELAMGFTYADARSDKLAKITDPVGGETIFAYDGAGKLQRITDPRGRITNVTVTELGDLTTFSEPDLETYQFVYAEHRMTQKQSPGGDLTSYTFRADGTLQTSTKPEGQVTTVDAVLSHPPTYDATSGNIVRGGGYTDGHGVAHQVETNLRGDIEKDTYVADGVTRVERAVYAQDAFIRDESPQDNSAIGETARRNRMFRVSQRTLNGIPLGPERKPWDAHFRPLTEFRAGTSTRTHRWTYAADGWLRAENRGAAWTQVFDRDTAGHVTRIFDSDGLTQGVFLLSGAETHMTYRADGQVATRTEHTIARTYSYDDAVGGTTNELGWTDTVGRSMAFLHDAKGNVIQSSDGTATTYATYDANNRVIETRDALSNATTYGYTNAGCGCSQSNQITSLHTPDLPVGVDWTMTYDKDGRLASVTDPQNFTESYAYEPTGERKKTTDKLARESLWTHDQLGRVLSMVDTLGRTHASRYVVPATGAWSGPTLLAGSADATASTTSLSTALRAGDYQIGHNAYPIDGYPADISLYRDATFALGFSRTFDYSKRLLSRVDRTGLAIDSVAAASPSASYWNEGKSWNVFTPRPVLWAAGTFSADVGHRNSSYSQDAYFDSTDATGSGFEQLQEIPLRDAAGRITTLTRKQNGVVATSTYAYRPDGRLSQLVNPDGTHDFTYNSRGLMATQVVSGEGTYTYGYDVMGRSSALTYPDGHTRTQLYDDLGRINSRCYEYAGGTIRCYTAHYDAVGNPTRMVDPDGADVFEYDALDRLKKVTREIGGVPGAVEDYAYNALGALKVNAGVTLDDQRPRLAGGGTTDAAVPASVGGQAIALDPGGRVTSLRGTTFKWSGEGALREVNPPIPAVAETYGVDSQGRRFNHALGGSIDEYYVLEGLDRVATLDASRALREGYLFDGIDHPLRIKIPATSTTAYYELDLAGNVRGLRASGGASLGQYRYSAFGMTVEDTSSINQPLRWKGRWFSPVAGGTYDVRARQWSPELGVFLSIDEYWAHDKKGTLWSWPKQNPIRFRDPRGRYGDGFHPPPGPPLPPDPPAPGPMCPLEKETDQEHRNRCGREAKAKFDECRSRKPPPPVPDCTDEANQVELECLAKGPQEK